MFRQLAGRFSFSEQKKGDPTNRVAYPNQPNNHHNNPALIYASLAAAQLAVWRLGDPGEHASLLKASGLTEKYIYLSLSMV
jgi:hypothetical protein